MSAAEHLKTWLHAHVDSMSQNELQELAVVVDQILAKGGVDALSILRTLLSRIEGHGAEPIILTQPDAAAEGLRLPAGVWGCYNTTGFSGPLSVGPTQVARVEPPAWAPPPLRPVLLALRPQYGSPYPDGGYPPGESPDTVLVSYTTAAGVWQKQIVATDIHRGLACLDGPAMTGVGVSVAPSFSSQTGSVCPAVYFEFERRPQLELEP